MHCLLGTGGQRNGALAIDSKVTSHRFKVIHVIGRCGHHGGQGILLAHGGRFKQHDGIGIVIHLEQFKAEIFRVKPPPAGWFGLNHTHVPAPAGPAARTPPAAAQTALPPWLQTPPAAAGGVVCRTVGFVLISCIAFPFFWGRLQKSYKSFLVIIPYYSASFNSAELPKVVKSPSQNLHIPVTGHPPGAKRRAQCPFRPAASSNWYRRKKKTAG